MRLIDADALIAKCGDWYTEEGPEEGFIGSIRQLIDEQPTIEERKKAHWIKVHGYATPGGDPVWCCSECGKGTHVWGIEHGSYAGDVADQQWLSCPNCDARMVER